MNRINQQVIIKKNFFYTLLLITIGCMSLIAVFLFMDISQDSKIKSSMQIFIIFILITECTIALFKKKIFDPRFLFIFIFLAHGTVGGANLLERGAFVDYYNEIYHLLFYSFFSITYILTTNQYYFFKLSISKQSQVNIKFAFILFYIGMLAMLLNWVKMGGIPILHGEEFRFNSDSKLLLIFLAGGIASTALMFTGKKIPFIITLVFSILTAFRFTPIFFIFIIIFDYLFFRQISYKKIFYIVMSGIIIFSLLNLVKLYRDIEYHGFDKFIEISEKQGASTSEYVLPFLPIIYTVIEGPQVFQQIREKFNGDYGLGKYYLETITTFLPGHQRSYGDIFNNITQAPTVNTKTATILGPMYIGGGLYFIVIISIFIAFSLKQSFLHAVSKPSILSRLFFLNYFTWLLVWIHAGQIFSVTFLVLSFLILILHVRIKF
jgi:hypothetical protein